MPVVLKILDILNKNTTQKELISKPYLTVKLLMVYKNYNEKFTIIVDIVLELWYATNKLERQK